MKSSCVHFALVVPSLPPSLSFLATQVGTPNRLSIMCVCEMSLKLQGEDAASATAEQSEFRESMTAEELSDWLLELISTVLSSEVSAWFC